MSEKISEILTDLGTITDRITDSQVAKGFEILLQLVEELHAENKSLKAENQKLRDEINLLKGEHPGPKINQSKKNKDISSEQERKARNRRKRKKSKSKKHKIKINRVEVCKVDPDILPEGAEFKGYSSVTVQELIIKADNVEYEREVYYSPSQQKTYIGQLPPGIQGGYGPGLISFNLK
jgi:predicted RNase H-like nuclease (RuvC/YqgF family)